MSTAVLVFATELTIDIGGGGADFASHITNCPPDFQTFNIPALLVLMLLKKIKIRAPPIYNKLHYYDPFLVTVLLKAMLYCQGQTCVYIACFQNEIWLRENLQAI